MSIIKTLISIAAELLTLRDPYQERVEPGVIEQVSDGWIVRGNSRDVSRMTAGMSVEGKRIVHEHLGRNRWKIRVE